MLQYLPEFLLLNTEERENHLQLNQYQDLVSFYIIQLYVTYNFLIKHIKIDKKNPFCKFTCFTYVVRKFMRKL